jgi:hypothetical protein
MSDVIFCTIKDDKPNPANDVGHRLQILSQGVRPSWPHVEGGTPSLLV